MCHAPTGDTNSNHCWCYDDGNPISKHNNRINNNDVGPSPLYNNDGSLIEDGSIPKYTFLCHTSISKANSNTQLIVGSSGLKERARKVMKGNNISNSVSPINNNSDCHPIKTNNHNNTHEMQ